MAGEIPIRNIYALLAFHWRALGIEGVSDVGQVEADTPLELLARVLVQGMRMQLRRGLAREYHEVAEDLSHPRGAICVDETLSRAVQVGQRLHCRYDELVSDSSANRLVKAGLRAVGRCPSLGETVRRTALGLVAQLGEVLDVPLGTIAATPISVPRSARSYAPLLDICRMLARHMLPDQADRGQRFRDIRLADRELAHLFEGFVRGFVRHHLDSHHRVSALQPKWAEAHGPETALALLPLMKTDVTVLGSRMIAVLETKFYRTPFRELEHGERLKLRSSHLYQLFAYVMNLARRNPDHSIRGGLLYASTGRGVEAELKLGEIPIMVRTIDLTLPWPELETVMQDIVRWTVAAAPLGAGMSETGG